MECREFGQFTLLDHMGRGGVGNVYRATDNVTGNIVAIKIFEPTAERGPHVVRKLRDREVRMLISIQHPNVVRYYESGSVGESCYYTMEFVENSLLKRMRQGPELELRDKVHILRQTCNALQAIHHQGIVHRDIKPGNILLDEAPSGAIHVKVTDLGIAKHVSETDVAREDPSRRVPGTPKYLAPEQIRLQPVDGRADVFSLGVVAYELLSGQPPFRAQSGEQYLRANLSQEPRAVNDVNPAVPGFLGPLVAKMLAKDREERYDSDSLAHDLELVYQHLVSGAPLVEEANPDSIFYVPAVTPAAPEPPASPLLRWRWLMACAIVLLGLGAGWVLRPEFPPPPGSRATSGRTEERREPAEALAAAQRLLEDGLRWKALAALRSIAPEALDEEGRKRLAELQRAAQDVPAQASFAHAMKRLQEGHLTEAKIILAQMQALFPHAGLTARLAEQIRAREELLARRQQWAEKTSRLRSMLGRGEFAEAVSQAARLLKEPPPEEALAEVRQLLVLGLNAWQESLLGSGTDPRQLRECVRLVGEYLGRDWAAEKLADRRPALYLRLSEHYRDLGAVEQEVATLTLIVERYGGSPAARQAQARMKRIVQEMRLAPVSVQLLSRMLEQDGFKGPEWFSAIPEGGEQSTADGTLVLVQQGELGERVNARQTVRPIRTELGFELRVRFRMRVEEGAAAGGCFAGLRVEDRQGNAVALEFDGASYHIARSYRRGGRVLTGSSSVREAFDDEGEAWHELGMRYRFDLSRLEVLLDGEPVGEPRVELGVCRIGVFVRVSGRARCRAEFKDIACRVP